MNIGQAVEAMKASDRVSRSGWNGKGMWIMMTDPTQVKQEIDKIPMPSFVVMRTADNNYVPWLCSQTDLLATDWEVVVE